MQPLREYQSSSFQGFSRLFKALLRFFKAFEAHYDIMDHCGYSCYHHYRMIVLLKLTSRGAPGPEEAILSLAERLAGGHPRRK